MKNIARRQSEISRWIAAWFLALPLAGASAEEKPLQFDGRPVNAVLSSGRDHTWVPKPPPVMVGVIQVGTTREVFHGFVDASIESTKKGIGASATRQRFTVSAAPEAEGRKFKGKVTFQVQEEVYTGFRKWRKMGPVVTKEAEIVVHIAQSRPPKIVVASKLSNDLKMVGDARAVDITPSSSPIADTDLGDPRRPLVIGKRPGRMQFKLKYQIEGQDLELPVLVEVVNEETTAPVTIDEGASVTIASPLFERNSRLRDWKLQEILGVKHPGIASAKKEKGMLVITGRDKGSTRVSAIFTATDPTAKPSKLLKIKAKLEVRVTAQAQAPAPN